MKKFAALILLVFTAALVFAQVSAPQPGPAQPPPPAVQAPKPEAPPTPPGKVGEKPETKITPQQAEELFRSVDEILKFVSDDTGLPIKHPVKRQLADRAQVVRYIQDRMKTDEDSKRLERASVVLKKFGLVPRTFELQSFLLDLLKEQVAGYYDSKTKTVYLLDWVEPEQQKPVLAHELTHALQDQNYGLEKLSKDAKKNDPTGLEVDERQAARQAVVEGQAMITLMDYILKPQGTSVADRPQVVDILQAGMSQAGPDMAVFNRAPLFLQQVLLFPYKYGASFERDLLVSGGKEQAFAKALQDPPKDTRQVMQPATYLDNQYVKPLKPVDFNKLTPGYKKWDLSVMGEFDVYLLVHQYVSGDAADVLSKDWRGGYYWAGLRPEAAKSKDPEPPVSDLALVYVSRWSSPNAAAQFAGVYAAALHQRYRSLQPEPGSAEVVAPTPVSRTPEKPQNKKTENKDEPRVTITVWPKLNGRAAWKTEEGEVIIEPRGDMVLVTEGVDAQTASKIHDAVFAGK